MWTCICFDSDLDFYKKEYQIIYNDHLLYIKRGDKNHGHELHVELDIDKGYEIGFCFLSELSWLFDTRIEYFTGGASSYKNSFNVAGRHFNRVGNGIYLDDYTQVANTKKQKIALGLYKEGLSSNSPFYKFLSFFKIINMFHPTGKSQKKWINDHISVITSNLPILLELKKKRTSVGEHLYHSGRCAIAHCNYSNGKTIINPDNPKDVRRINSEYRLMQEFAKYIIEKELKVPNRQTMEKNKRMKGLIKLFGNRLVSDIKRCLKINPKRYPDIPALNFFIFDITIDFFAFKNINLSVYKIDKGIAYLHNYTTNDPVKVRFGIDFINKKIIFDIYSFQYSKSAHPSFEKHFEKNYYQFFREFILNGRVAIHDISNNVITISSAFLPMNIDPGATIASIDSKINSL